jgi:hypothetical protein
MKLYLYAGIACLLSFLAGKYLFSPKPQVKEVVKTVTVEKYVEKRNVVKKTRTTKAKDGTEVTEVTETDKSVIVDNRKSQVERRSEIKGNSKLTLGLLAIKPINDFGKPFEYGATVSVPVIGSIKAQGLVTTDKKVGLGVAIDF